MAFPAYEGALMAAVRTIPEPPALYPVDVASARLRLLDL